MKGARGRPLEKMEQSKKSFLKNMAGFSMVAWISAVIGFISGPVGTWLFLPEEMAKVNLFSTYASLFASFCYLGLDQAFVRFFREPLGRSTRRSMFTFCVLTSLSFSLLSSGILLLAWQGITSQVVGEADAGVFLCLFVFSFCTVLYRYLSLCYRMEQNAKLYTLQGVIYVVITKIAYLSVGFADAQGKSAILALTLLMGVFTLVFVLIQRKRFDPRFWTQLDKPFFTGMATYAVPLIPITVIAMLNESISQLALKLLDGFVAVGIYGIALRLASTVNILQTGFNAYWAPYVYENYKTDNKHRFFTIHRLMACVLTFFGLTVTLLQAPLFLLLGKAYQGAVVFFPFLFLAPICYCLSETTGMGIGIAKKTHWNTLAFLASVLLNLALSYALIPIWGAVGAALSSAAAAILSLVLRTWAGERYYKAISDYRYLAYTLGLMLAASFGNLLLADAPLAKYALLVSLLSLGCFLYRRELKTLWITARQILTEGMSALSPRTRNTPPGND